MIRSSATRCRLAQLCLLLVMTWLLVGNAAAQTRAWLERETIAMGETSTLNIETDEPAARMPDFSGLQQDFRLSGHSSRRSFQRDGSGLRTRTLFAVALHPLREGVLQIPPMQVGAARTAPLQLQVQAASQAPPVRGSGELFIESQTDAAAPWVQQAVGHVVRVYSALPLLSGTLEQDVPDGASLRRVGDDAQYSRQINGRRYQVIERRYLLIPERSGRLQIPHARFSGQGAGGWFDQWFGDGRRQLQATGGGRSLQVQAPPDNAPQPWLPLRSLRLRWLQAPEGHLAVGETAYATLELLADGAQAAQLGELDLPAVDGLQVFGEAAQVHETYEDGRPQLRIVRSFVLLPEHGGALQQPGPRLPWWDVDSGVLRTATVPPLQLQVQGAPAGKAVEGPVGTAGESADARGAAQLAAGIWQWLRRHWQMVGLSLLALAAGIVALLWWLRGPAASHRASKARRHEARQDLQRALAAADLPAIDRALQALAAKQFGDDVQLAAVLDDPGQRAAIDALQRARWQGGDATAAAQQLRRAFATGPRWRIPERSRSGVVASRRRSGSEPVLPPLYPPPRA